MQIVGVRTLRRYKAGRLIINFSYGWPRTMLKNIIYSFPIQLLLLHFKKNQFLLLGWFILFAMVSGALGKVFGIPYLFLDPEYMNKTDFWSFFLLGLSLGGLTMAYHITCYIIEGHRFSFLGSLARPFFKFCINNALLPLIFIIYYIYSFIFFQIDNEFSTTGEIIQKISGFFSGFLLMQTLLFAYFRFTNTDIIRLLAASVDKKLKRSNISRANVMRRLNVARKNKIRVETYLDYKLKPKLVSSAYYFDRAAITRVFDQNHLNSVIIALVWVLLILALGFFQENAYFQIPAAASFMLLISIFFMLSGAMAFWLRSWAISAAIVLFILINLAVKWGVITADYQAYGLDYSKTPVAYTIATLLQQNSSEQYEIDKAATLEILENWRAKFPDKKPKMVFICSSGGGQRAALWTLKSLQVIDSVSNGEVMRHSALITGASGGLIGASYFRELYLRKQQGEAIDLQNEVYRQKISSDHLNPIIFSMVVNDLFIRHQKFQYGNHSYFKDRGYAFERQLSCSTDGILDKPIIAYREPEIQATIPMLFLAPTIVNDGRRLFISPQNISYMNTAAPTGNFPTQDLKVKGVEFRKLFKNHDADSLRFLSALRMNATFPYITPNTALPSMPPMEIMDAGLADNFGIADAVRFLYVFRSWIAENTDGVIFLSIRDSDKIRPIEQNVKHSLIQKFATPLRSIYNNWANLQDLNNDALIEFANTWFENDIENINIQYVPRSIELYPTAISSVRDQQIDREIERASLSWRLTSREKYNIEQNIYNAQNQRALQRLKEAFQ